MEKDIAIKVENLTKIYPLRFTKKDEEGREVSHHKALENVSFEVKKGESVGIVGPNGSGKSTLLKILAGVSKPTSGKVKIRGKVASILDIGAGFHPELSGRENVYLNGQIHGFRKKEIEKKMDDIIAFSGIGDFIEEPVKNYSNGMYLRLAFSIMAHLDFDVYLFDEVLSVGDAEFVYKTQEKFQLLIQRKKTILLVSHDLGAMENLNRYIYIYDGGVSSKLKSSSFLSEYLEDILKKELAFQSEDILKVTDFSKYPESEDIKLISVELYQEHAENRIFSHYETIIRIELMKLNNNTIDPVLYLSDFQNKNLMVTTPLINQQASKDFSSSRCIYKVKIPVNFLNNKIYNISVAFIKNSYLVNEIHLNKKSNKVGMIPIFKNILTFRPTLKINGIDTYFTKDFQNNSGLLIGLPWKIEK